MHPVFLLTEEYHFFQSFFGLVYLELIVELSVSLELHYFDSKNINLCTTFKLKSSKPNSNYYKVDEELGRGEDLSFITGNLLGHSGRAM